MMEDPRFCKNCLHRVSDKQSFLCKLGYWASTSPHTIKMEDDKVIRPQACVDSLGYARR